MSINKQDWREETRETTSGEISQETRGRISGQGARMSRKMIGMTRRWVRGNTCRETDGKISEDWKEPHTERRRETC
jgi:hypothetical protein